MFVLLKVWECRVIRCDVMRCEQGHGADRDGEDVQGVSNKTRGIGLPLKNDIIINTSKAMYNLDHRDRKMSLLYFT